MKGGTQRRLQTCLRPSCLPGGDSARCPLVASRPGSNKTNAQPRGARQQGPEHPASSTSALSPPAPAGAPQARSTQQAACRESARAAAPVLEPLTICSEPVLCERSPGRHCRLLARRAAPRSPGGARRPRRPRCSPGGPARGLSEARREAEAASPSTPGAARRGGLSLPGRGHSERRRRQVFTPTPAGEPAPLPSTGPPGAGRPHMGDTQGRQGDPQRPRSPSSVSGGAALGPTADCPQSLHVVKSEINAGERVQSRVSSSDKNKICMYARVTKYCHFCDST